jgi:tRNA (guanine37-N1)-methyltransferase
LPGALGNQASSQNESFAPVPDAREAAKERSLRKMEESAEGGGQVLLDFPHYTRPAEYRGWTVPEVLIGGNHAEVAKWRSEAAREKTRRNRPDLWQRD